MSFIRYALNGNYKRYFNNLKEISRKEKISVSEIEDAMQGSLERGSMSLLNSLSELVLKGKITTEQAKAQIEEKNLDALERTINNLKAKKGPMGV